MNFELSKITVSYGATLNMGNYQSARIDSSVELKVTGKQTTPEEFEEIKEEAFKEAWKICWHEVMKKKKALENAGKKEDSYE